MQAVVDALSAIFEMFETVFNFFKGLVANLMMLFEYIGLAASTAYNLVASLPVWLQAFGTATILISILYLILGRSTGGDKSD